MKPKTKKIAIAGAVGLGALMLLGGAGALGGSGSGSVGGLDSDDSMFPLVDGGATPRDSGSELYLDNLQQESIIGEEYLNPVSPTILESYGTSSRNSSYPVPSTADTLGSASALEPYLSPAARSRVEQTAQSYRYFKIPSIVNTKSPTSSNLMTGQSSSVSSRSSSGYSYLNSNSRASVTPRSTVTPTAPARNSRMAASHYTPAATARAAQVRAIAAQRQASGYYNR